MMGPLNGPQKFYRRVKIPQKWKNYDFIYVGSGKDSKAALHEEKLNLN